MINYIVYITDFAWNSLIMSVPFLENYWQETK